VEKDFECFEKAGIASLKSGDGKMKLILQHNLKQAIAIAFKTETE